ncbi:hypothetical protein FRC11_006366 [Ceratobasidium sp. 423]|nr:hypothetical protein FRC11_006366 [Ceratobasidium sp. 423]
MAKPPVSMPAACQLSKSTPKPSIPPTSRDTPALGVGPSSQSKGVTAVNNSDGDSSSLPDSPIVSLARGPPFLSISDVNQAASPY